MGQNTQASGFQAPPGNGHDMKAQAHRLGDAMKQRAIATSDAKKTFFADQVGELVTRLEGISQPREGTEPGLQEQVVGRGVALLHKLESTLHENSTEELIGKVEQQMRARPGLFVAGCVALGFLGARLVRK
jgi:hypothetical protein